MPHTTGVVWPISHQIDPILRNQALYSRIFMAKVSAYGGEPLPASRHPPWRYPHGPLHGKTPEKNQFLALSPPGKLTSAPLPGHGFPPDIAMTALPPGGGEEARSAGRVGLPEKRMSIPSRNAGRGGVAGEERADTHLRGGETPPGPHPPAISPRSTPWEDPGEEPDTAFQQISP